MLKTFIIFRYLALLVGAVAVPSLQGYEDLEKILQVAIANGKVLCESAGHPEVFNNVQNVEAISSCMNSATNLLQLYNDMATPQASVKAEEFADSYCKLDSEFAPKCKLTYKVTKPCKSLEEQKIDENVASAGNCLSKYVCHDHKEKLISFIADGGVTCISKQLLNIISCVSNYKNIHDIYSIEKDWKKLNVSQACIVRELATCKPSAANEFNSLVNYLKENIPCHNSAKGPQSSKQWYMLISLYIIVKSMSII